MGFFDVVSDIGAAAVGPIVGGIMGMKGQEATNAANLQISREQMGFQEKMSNSAYQRSMADMQKAGLNPMLAYSQGGASSPSGAAIAMQNPMTPLSQGLTQGITSGLDALRLKKDINQTDSTIKLQNVQTGVQEEQKKLTANSARTAEITAKMAAAKLPVVKAQAEYQKKQAEWDTKALSYDNWMRRIGEGIGIIRNAFTGSKALINIGGSNKEKSDPYNPKKIKYGTDGYVQPDNDF